jgi:hypothetical protein
MNSIEVSSFVIFTFIQWVVSFGCVKGIYFGEKEGCGQGVDGLESKVKN